jgi:hypothetical protein
MSLSMGLLGESTIWLHRGFRRENAGAHDTGRKIPRRLREQRSRIYRNLRLRSPVAERSGLQAAPPLQGKDALHRLLPANRRIRSATNIPDSCSDLWQLADTMELEGIVAKRADSAYTAGRSDCGRRSRLRRASEGEQEAALT